MQRFFFLAEKRKRKRKASQNVKKLPAGDLIPWFLVLFPLAMEFVLVFKKERKKKKKSQNSNSQGWVISPMGNKGIISFFNCNKFGSSLIVGATY